MAWPAAVDEEQLFLSIVAVAELRYGVEHLAAGRRKTALDCWLTDQLTQRFGDRMLGLDADTADRWGRIVADAEARGRPIGAMDAFIAAVAAQHQLTVVTRNVADFEEIGVRPRWAVGAPTAHFSDNSGPLVHQQPTPDRVRACC